MGIDVQKAGVVANKLLVDTCPPNICLSAFGGRFDEFFFVFAEIFQSCPAFWDGLDNSLVSIVRKKVEFLNDIAAFFSKLKETNSPSVGDVCI